MKILLLFILFTTEVFALEAVVTVLETPLFSSPSYDANVVQYLRKGDVIKIHPSIGNDRNMDQYAPSPEKLKVLREKMRETPEYKEDPMFTGEESTTFYLEDEFIPTLDRQGHIAYVLSEHIYVYFNDARELEQKFIAKDPTDYRLEEPLPRKYPLYSPTGYRGQFLIGLTQPNYESYPYPDKVGTKGYTSPVDLTVTLLKQAPGNYQERLFIGGTMNFRTYQNSYTFSNLRTSEETAIKFSLGPTISYDAFKGEKNRINLSGTVIVNLIDRLYISQESTAVTDSRTYTGISLAPRFNLQYHRKQILEDLDFVLGTLMEVGTPTTFQAKNAGSQSSWWQHLGNDKFTTRTTFTLGGYVGIQSAY